MARPARRRAVSTIRARKRRSSSKMRKADPRVSDFIFLRVSDLKEALAGRGYDVNKNNLALRSLVKRGLLVQTKRTGARRSFKVSKRALGRRPAWRRARRRRATKRAPRRVKRSRRRAKKSSTKRVTMRRRRKVKAAKRNAAKRKRSKVRRRRAARKDEQAPKESNQSITIQNPYEPSWCHLI